MLLSQQRSDDIKEKAPSLGRCEQNLFKRKWNGKPERKNARTEMTKQHERARGTRTVPSRSRKEAQPEMAAARIERTRDALFEGSAPGWSYGQEDIVEMKLPRLHKRLSKAQSAITAQLCTEKVGSPRRSQDAKRFPIFCLLDTKVRHDIFKKAGSQNLQTMLQFQKGIQAFTN